MKQLGWILVVISGLVVVYAMSMTTTVSTGLGDVHNIGLIERKQSLLMVSIAGVCIGVALLVAQAFLDQQSTGSSQPQGTAEHSSSVQGSQPPVATFMPTHAECAFCGAIVEHPMEPCSAFSIDELQASPDSIEDEECIAALRKANIFDLPPQFTDDGKS